ncbi:MAG: putative TIM-barrel fold metal-dependent hydrolase [Halioglobus sp.]|jgi:predicted TIM-barrel fold metal-dependent hydrolase
MAKLVMISADCHAGALPEEYKQYMPKELHAAGDAWWLEYAREMMKRMGTFFDQEAAQDFNSRSGDQGAGRMDPNAAATAARASDTELWDFLCDPDSIIAPRRGEYLADVRLKELEDDGIAGEVIFPQMAPFGAGLMQYRHDVTPEQSLAGNRAYNHWLADMCKINPGRHAGVAIINVDDISVAVEEVRTAQKLGLFGGVLLPTSTGTHPFYHDYARYAPLWTVCEELNMPIHTHSGWSPDYGDLPSATTMYISEVDMWAQRPFTALLWSGVFEKHPSLKLIFTETGCGWILETLRVLKFKTDNPIFAHFTKHLSLTPQEYFQRNCFIGASFLAPHEVGSRHAIGIDKLMWGSDYPHMEGTWPNTREKLQETFHDVDEGEIRDILGNNAIDVFGFDRKLMEDAASKIGPQLSDIQQAPS